MQMSIAVGLGPTSEVANRPCTENFYDQMASHDNVLGVVPMDQPLRRDWHRCLGTTNLTSDWWIGSGLAFGSLGLGQDWYLGLGLNDYRVLVCHVWFRIGFWVVRIGSGLEFRIRTGWI